MKIKPTRRTTTAALCLVLAIGGTATATAASRGEAPAPTTVTQPADGDVVRDFSAVTRATAWQQTGKLKLDFPTYHTEGIAFAGGHIFLSAVQILEPTQKYPAPQDGYDRTAGRGVGHVFVMDEQGHLQRDIVLGEGDMYHPGGIDSDGTSIWVPVAQYRPNSSALLYTIDVKTLDVRKRFEVKDHIGAIARDAVTGNLVGNSWGSRHFYEWNSQGRQLADWDNQNHVVDYQDCQYVPSRKLICGGITNLPQTPAAGGSAATYELGGISLVDLRSHAILHEVPFQQWTSGGHVATRNPVKFAADGNRLTMWAAPDNDDRGIDTEILTYQATVNPAP